MSHLLAFEWHRLRIERLDCWTETPDPQVANHRGNVIAWHKELTEERHRTRGTDCATLHEFFLRRCRFSSSASAMSSLAGPSSRCTGRAEQRRDRIGCLDSGQSLRPGTHLGTPGARDDEDRQSSVLRTGEEDQRQPEEATKSSDVARPRSVLLPEDEQRRRWFSARRRLDDARQSLTEAENLLRRGRRLTGQWIRLYGAKAQLEIEALLLAMCQLELETYESRNARMRFLVQVHNTLHRGLEAFRGGWDCVHAPDRTNREVVKVDREPWLARWVQLMIGGYTLCYFLPDAVNGGREQPASHSQDEAGIVMRHNRNKETQTELVWTEPDQYGALWQSLNDSVGIERLLNGIPVVR